MNRPQKVGKVFNLLGSVQLSGGADFYSDNVDGPIEEGQKFKWMDSRNY